MRKILLIIIVLLNLHYCYAQNAGYIKLDSAKFKTGNQAEWKDPAFADAQWKVIATNQVWQNQGFPDYHGYAWYRIHVRIPSSLKKNSKWADSLRIFLAHVNDVDETYLNGELIGKIGGFPEDAGGYVSKWPAVRSYILAANSSVIKWDQDNVIAVKVFDGGGTGGIFMGYPYLDMLEKNDGVEFDSKAICFSPTGSSTRILILHNKFNTTINGSFHYEINDAAENKVLKNVTVSAKLMPFASKEIALVFPNREGIEISYTFTDLSTGRYKSRQEVEPYLLTPQTPLTPVINAPGVLGVGQSHPVLYRIPVSGPRPITYQITGLPAGLNIDEKTGIISGVTNTNGSFPLSITVKNSLGIDKQVLILKVGSKLALTPPMGWNSWNCWGLSVSAEHVKNSAKAMMDKGLVDYGWSYINIDDGWQAETRNTNGTIRPNAKFSDMNSFGDYLHSQGLKFGIYSSPGAKTCGGFLGSLGYEGKDAETYNSWGVDYLKYDLCSYTDNIGTDTSLYAQQKPYMLMRDELKKQPRDIIYSLCQYGIKDVWKWGSQMNGNSWRTTEDITDTWESLYQIGFSQNGLARYAHPGGWNDPDMLIVGRVGWGANLHASNLTPYEQYTHISLWSLLSAPLLIGCDMNNLDDFTLNLLKNRNVIAIDQDVLGAQADRVIDQNGFQVWVKAMADGSKAIGIFNLTNAYSSYNLKLSDAGISNASGVKDVWTQKMINVSDNQMSFHIPPHGVKLIQVSK